MILEAKYTGPLPEVTVPGADKRLAKRGEVVKIALRGTVVLGGCWEIVKGQKEYDAHVAAIDAEKEEIAKMKAERRAKAKGLIPEPEKAGVRNAEKAATPKPDKKEK